MLMQNRIIESFMRALKEGCVWVHDFGTFTEAQRIIETGIRQYNVDRPHQELG